ncbi:SpaA isopeptide-forming pilin-related protein [Streptomyces sp. NBC_00853]|uniref:MSCRAMM family protein n=1 Tax=Streptomyces sp. NBC_00853 TaxID=2903681 RepID=UPI003872BC6D|nr:SpaA isopeptide-forming pilin-related protein [Streptomyces sp. NBC_00853]
MRATRRTAATLAATTLATSSLIWAPTAFANAPEIPPGAVEITKKDPDGTLLAGAAFSLLDTLNGTKALTGRTNAEGILRFENVHPGTYRLKETDSGSRLHDLAPDQDVIVTPEHTAKLTIIDAFKPAELLVKKTDKKTGTPLAGAVINITPSTGTGKAITLTTGKDGAATAKLPVSSRNGTAYTGTEITAPTGYGLDTTPVKITAKPGEKTTATFTNSKKDKPTQPPTTPPTTPPVTPPTTPATTPPATPTPSQSTSTAPVPPTDTPSTPPAKGSLAHTGAESNAWLLVGGGLLIAAGGGVFIAARRRKADGEEEGQTIS